MVATATAQDRTHDRAHIGDGVVTDRQRIPRSLSRFRFYHLTPAVFSVVVHPAFPRFPTCSCHTLIRELIPPCNLLSPMRHLFLLLLPPLRPYVPHPPHGKNLGLSTN